MRCPILASQKRYLSYVAISARLCLSMSAFGTIVASIAARLLIPCRSHAVAAKPFPFLVPCVCASATDSDNLLLRAEVGVWIEEMGVEIVDAHARWRWGAGMRWISGACWLG